MHHISYTWHENNLKESEDGTKAQSLFFRLISLCFLFQYRKRPLLFLLLPCTLSILMYISVMIGLLKKTAGSCVVGAHFYPMWQSWFQLIADFSLDVISKEILVNSFILLFLTLSLSCTLIQAASAWSRGFEHCHSTQHNNVNAMLSFFHYFSVFAVSVSSCNLFSSVLGRRSICMMSLYL